MKEIRTCVVCRTKNTKSKLNRVYTDSDGNVKLDKNQKKQQRASYVCYNVKCHNKLSNLKLLNRIFKSQMSQQNQTMFLNSLKSESED